METVNCVKPIWEQVFNRSATEKGREQSLDEIVKDIYLEKVASKRLEIFKSIEEINSFSVPKSCIEKGSTFLRNKLCIFDFNPHSRCIKGLENCQYLHRQDLSPTGQEKYRTFF